VVRKWANCRFGPWTGQFTDMTMDQLGPLASGRLVEPSTCRGCGVAKVLALAVNSSSVEEWLVSVPQMGLSLGSVGHGLKAPRKLSGTRVCSQ